MRPLSELLEAERPAIYAICLRILRHPQDAEDACQEALIEAAREADSVRDERKLAAWVRRVATTTALDFRRRRDRRRTHEAQVPPPSADASPPIELERALSSLDAPERRAVEAHYLDGRPLRELAREQGVSEVAVWKRLGKAKNKLRLILAAALPAAIIAASLMVALLRPAAPAPAVPQEEREPWPWELPPRDWPEPMKKAWTALQKRVTLDVANVPLEELLGMIGGLIAHPIEGRVPPGEIISFKVQDISAEGALRLGLGPRGKTFQIRPDGGIVVLPAGELDPNADWSRSKTLRDARLLENAKRSPAVPRPLARARADFAKLVDGPAGDQSLDDYLSKLRERADARVLLDDARAAGSTRVVGVPERLSLETHLRRALEPLDLEAVPEADGAILVTRPQRAAELRGSEAYRLQERVEAALDRPLGADVASVSQLVRRLEKVLDAPVLATKEAWTSTASAAPKPGESIAALLDRLQADKIAWSVREGVLYLIK